MDKKEWMPLLLEKLKQRPLKLKLSRTHHSIVKHGSSRGLHVASLNATFLAKRCGLFETRREFCLAKAKEIRKLGKKMFPFSAMGQVFFA